MVTTPKRFEVYWASLDPTLGAEIKKTRPCVVISPNELNERLQTVIVAPVTSTLRDYPTRPYVRIEGKQGQLTLDQIRVIDKRRLRQKISTLSPKERVEALHILQELFAE